MVLFLCTETKGNTMARIEFNDVEQKMADLKGFCKTWADPEKNPYTTDKLHDDDFNFISGMNYVLSYITDLFLGNLDDYICDEDSETLDAFKKEIAKKTIEGFAEFGYSDLEQCITAALESEEYDDDFAEEE